MNQNKVIKAKLVKNLINLRNLKNLRNHLNKWIKMQIQNYNH